MNVGAPELLILLVVFGGGGALIYVMTRSSSGAGRPTTLAPARPVVAAGSPDQVMARVVQLLVTNGAVVTSQSPTSVTGHVMTKKKPSILVAVLLWFICIIPMIIYLINASKDEQDPFSLALSPVPGGTRIEGGGTGRGVAAVSWVLAQLASTSIAIDVPADARLSSSPQGPTPGGDPAPAPAPSAPPAGWYNEPNGGTSLRWWDGARWTDHSRDA